MADATSTPPRNPAWRKVDCPTCEAIAGEPCNREDAGAGCGVWPYQGVAPHAARKRAAAGADAPRIPA